MDGDVVRTETTVGAADLLAAQARLRRYLAVTPLHHAERFGCWLKLENLQRTGSYKVRGALNALLAARERGFVDAAGYRFARLSEYFGRFLRHGNAYPDRVLRLFDRRRGGWRGTREVHEAASVDGAVATLRGDLIHYPYRSLQQQLAKTERYARMMAEHEHARGKRATLAKLVLAPAWRFWRGYLLRGGFRDGWHGLVYAYVRANYVRQKTIMLWMLGNGQPVVTPEPKDDGAA